MPLTVTCFISARQLKEIYSKCVQFHGNVHGKNVQFFLVTTTVKGLLPQSKMVQVSGWH